MTAVETIEADGVVAVVRLDDLSAAVPLTEALVAGGGRAVEFTFTNRLAAQALAGAEYVVTPTLKRATIELCNRYGVPTVCGALTPTEILTAWEAGARYVKVHPASLGGPR